MRCRILKAYEGGGVSLGELAERFRLSLSYDFLNVGAAYRRNQFSVALRSHF